MTAPRPSSRRTVARFAALVGMACGAAGAGVLAFFLARGLHHRPFPLELVLLTGLGLAVWLALWVFFDQDAKRLGGQSPRWLLWVIPLLALLANGQSRLDWAIRWGLVGGSLLVTFVVWLRAVRKARAAPTNPASPAA